MVKQFKVLAVFLFSCFFLARAEAYAQEASVSAAPAAETPAMPATGDTTVATPAPAPEPLVGGLTKTELLAPFSGSFFLTPVEIISIQQAMAGRVTSAKTLSAAAKQQVQVNQIIRISGVVYHAPEDWIVWVNGQKVTPGNLLPEMIDIKVRDSSAVALKWFDINNGRVIAITLRPQQTYDVTTGILLPGSQ